MRNKNNPKLFREMAEPFETVEKLQEALHAFFDEVGKAREKHKLTNVVILAQSPVVDDGDELIYGGQLSLGDSSAVLPMLAGAYGDARADYEKLVAKLAQGKR